MSFQGYIMPNGGRIVESRFIEPLRGNKLVREIVAEEGKRLLVRVIGRFEKMRVRGIGIPLHVVCQFFTVTVKLCLKRFFWYFQPRSILRLVCHARIYLIITVLFRVGLAGMGLSASHDQNSQLNHRRKTTKLRNSAGHPPRGRRAIASAN